MLYDYSGIRVKTREIATTATVNYKRCNLVKHMGLLYHGMHNVIAITLKGEGTMITVNYSSQTPIIRHRHHVVIAIK